MRLAECHGPAARCPGSLLAQPARGKKLQSPGQALTSTNSWQSSQAETLGPSEGFLQFSPWLSFAWPGSLFLQCPLASSLRFPHRPLAPRQEQGLAVRQKRPGLCFGSCCTAPCGVGHWGWCTRHHQLLLSAVGCAQMVEASQRYRRRKEAADETGLGGRGASTRSTGNLVVFASGELRLTLQSLC